MHVLRYKSENLENIYGIRGRLLAAPNEAVLMGSMQGSLAPGESTRYHAHHEHEQFIIISGHGIIRSGDEEISINSGDVISFSAGESHQLLNTDTEQNLIFFSNWWAYAEGAVIDKRENDNQVQTQHIIISPPATPNGNLHLGHLAGPYLAADFLRRYLLQIGQNTFHITGSDDHQSYVTLKATRSQQSVENVVEHYSNNIRNTLEKYNAAPDLFYRPLCDQSYISFIKEFFVVLYQKGVVRSQLLNMSYCEQCQRWLYEAHLSGYCNDCHSPCGGGSCETCAMPNDGTQLQQPYCKYCRETPSLRSIEILVFDLQRYSKPLQKYLDQLVLPSHIRSLKRKLFEKTLPVIAVTHPADWGVTLPIKGFEHQRLCTWSEMAPAYIYASRLANMQNQQQTTLLFGFDNSFFYTILLPALYMAYDEKLKLPNNIVYNEFYLFDQEKFSTSREHAVWAHEIIQYFDSDYLRYYLAATRPEINRTSFSYSAFINLINQDLATNVSHWLLQLAERVHRDFQNCCPDGGEWQIEHTEFSNYLQQFILQASRAYSPATFSPSTIIRLLQELILRAKKLSASSNYLSTQYYFNRLDYQTSIVLELTALKYFAMVINAIMPTYARKLAAAIGLPENLIWENEVRLLPKGNKINELINCQISPIALPNFVQQMGEVYA